MRGIGVAVMWRTCGARPSTSAERCSTPKRCCSSTTATARSRNSKPFWISACVPDDDVRLAADLRLDRAGDERAADAELHAEALDREEVLLGERLGRRHQRALAAGLDRPQERVERDDRLAGADVALEQALHRRRAREVGVDLGDRLLLMLGQLERECGAVAADQLARLRQRGGDLLLALGSAPRQRQLEDEQLVEGEPLPSLLGLLERARLVDRRQRVASERQPALRLQRRRQRVGMVGHERQRRLDELAQLRRRDLLARRIDRREVGRRRAAVEVERAHGEAEAVRGAAQTHVRARLQLLLQPGLVEPGRADLAGPVGRPARSGSGAGRGRGAATSAAPRLRSAPPRRRRGRRSAAPAPAARSGAAGGRAGRPIALEPELRQPLLQRRPDARQRVERRLESLRAGSAPRVGAQRSGGSTAAKPGWGRLIARVSQPVRLDRLEPEEADRAGSGMRADDGAEARHELHVRLRPAREHDRLQLLDRVRRFRVRRSPPRAPGRRWSPPRSASGTRRTPLPARGPASPGRPRRPRSPGSASRSGGSPSAPCRARSGRPWRGTRACRR